MKEKIRLARKRHKRQQAIEGLKSSGKNLAVMAGIFLFMWGASSLLIKHFADKEERKMLSLYVFVTAWKNCSGTSDLAYIAKLSDEKRKEIFRCMEEVKKHLTDNDARLAKQGLSEKVLQELQTQKMELEKLKDSAGIPRP